MKKQITAWILLAALLTGLLSACGSGAADGAQAAPDELAAKYTYQAHYVDLDVDASEQFDTIGQYCVSGNAMFFVGGCVSGSTIYVDPLTGEPWIDETTGEPMEIDNYEMFLYRTDLDSGKTVRLDGYAPLALAEGQLGSADVAAMAAGADGTVWILDRLDTYSYDLPETFDPEQDDISDYYTQGESSLSLRQYDADGHMLQSVDLSGLEAQYPNQLLVDQAGNFFLNATDAIYVLDAGGAVLATLENSSVLALCQISETEIGVLRSASNTGSMALQPVDPKTGAYGKETALPVNTCWVYPGMENDRYLYDDGTAVYGCDAETGTAEKLLSWLDCGISRSALNQITFLEDGRIVTLSADSSQTPVQYALLFLEQADPSALPQEQEQAQELTLAGWSISKNMIDYIRYFNQMHSDVRIVVKDYSEYDTAEDAYAGKTKLYTEILAGDMPDIIYNASLPLDQMASMGMLVDLWPLIDGDEEFGREDLMTHLFDVMSLDGGLYWITSEFEINTAVGNADVIGDRTSWTLDEMLEVWETLPEGASLLGETATKRDVLSTCVNYNLRSFIDWEAKTCSFDSPAFLDILNLANSFPSESDALVDYAEFDMTEELLLQERAHSRMRNGEQLLEPAYFSSFYGMQSYAAFAGGNPCYVGYPSVDGSGTVFWVTGMSITSACRDVDLAWSFVRTFLTEEYQNALFMPELYPNSYNYSSVSHGFPTNRHTFEAVLKECMTPKYQTDPETGEQVEVPSATITYGEKFELWAVSQEDYDMFMQIYDSCGSVYSYNDTVWNIIVEETEPFFDGQKTAEEVAALIQNRVGLYVMEQG